MSEPVIMGILNITPDSFYDGGKYSNEKDWLQQAETMLSESASILDIGAVSTRPGSKLISEKEELDRLMPVITSLRKSFPEAILSVDTFRSEVAKIAVDNGADIINDIFAGSFDNKMFDTVASLKIPYVIMHLQGTPQNMQTNPQYENVLNDIIMFFSEKINRLKLIGINDIVIDPGFGFGKTLAHNFKILNNLDMFRIFELPVLIGVSRKSMICKTLGISPANALNGTTALNAAGLLKGANIIRVHDVKEANEAIKLISMLKH